LTDQIPPKNAADKSKASAGTIAIAFVISAVCAAGLLIFAFGFGHQG
jgi:hypothetical protein